jgi:hypothetical protein
MQETVEARDDLIALGLEREPVALEPCELELGLDRILLRGASRDVLRFRALLDLFEQRPVLRVDFEGARGDEVVVVELRCQQRELELDRVELGRLTFGHRARDIACEPSLAGERNPLPDRERLSQRRVCGDAERRELVARDRILERRDLRNLRERGTERLASRVDAGIAREHGGHERRPSERLVHRERRRAIVLPRRTWLSIRAPQHVLARRRVRCTATCRGQRQAREQAWKCRSHDPRLLSPRAWRWTRLGLERAESMRMPHGIAATGERIPPRDGGLLSAGS